MKHRIPAILIALCIVLSTAPMAVSAACGTCEDADGDYVCDVCWKLLEHPRTDANGDYCCAVCFGSYGHICADDDGDYPCDICRNLKPHLCADEDGDYTCDLCAATFMHPVRMRMATSGATFAMN